MLRLIWSARWRLLTVGAALVAALLISDVVAPGTVVRASDTAASAGSSTDAALAVAPAETGTVEQLPPADSAALSSVSSVADALASARAASDSTEGVATVAPAAASEQTDSAAAVSTIGGDLELTVTVPRNPADDVTIANPETGVVGIGLPQADSAGAAQRLDDGAVVYPGGGASSNAVIPTARGVQLLTVIEDVTAPEKYDYPLTLPEGAHLQTLGSGVEVVDADGDTLIVLTSAWAKDARGVLIPTRYELEGNTVVQVIEHTSVDDVAYPVVADPNWLSLVTTAGIAILTKALTAEYEKYVVAIKASMACISDGLSKAIAKSSMDAFYFACVKGMASSLIEQGVSWATDSPIAGDMVSGCFKAAWADWGTFDTSAFGCLVGIAGAGAKNLAKGIVGDVGGKWAKAAVDGLGKAASEGTKAALMASKPLVDQGVALSETWLGTTVSTKICGMIDGGCRRYNTGGVLYASNKTGGVRSVPTTVMDLWGKWGWETGPLGWPIDDPRSTGSVKKNQYLQTFERGVIVVTDNVAEIAYATDPGLVAWSKNRWLGDPPQKYSPYCKLVGGGCFAAFPAGNVYWSANSNGAHPVPTAILNEWGKTRWENGWWGYPTSDPSVPDPTRATQYTQTFQGGRQALYLHGKVYDPLASLGMASPWLGAATGALVCDIKLTPEDRWDARRSGCQREFARGVAYVSGSSGGMHAVPSVIVTALRRSSTTAGAVGWPLSDPIDDAGRPVADPARSLNYRQVFEKATIAVRNGTAFIEYANVTASSKRAATAWLGSTVDVAPVCGFRDLGCLQHYSGGTVYWSNTSGGVRAVPNAVMTKWGELGYENGPLGYPSGDPSADPRTATTYTQAFQNGYLIVVASGRAYGPFKTSGAANSWLGPQIRGFVCATRVAKNDACSWVFENGILAASEVDQTMYAVPRAIVESDWGMLGREGGIMGMPTGEPVAPGTGAPIANPAAALNYTQSFAGGTMTVESGIPRISAVTGPTLTAWMHNRWLGAPIDETTNCWIKDNGCFKHFANGSLYWSDTTGGVRVVPAAVMRKWGESSWENGQLGYPISDPSADPTSGVDYQQVFQNGRILVTHDASGRESTVTPADAVAAVVRANSWLGAAQGGKLECWLTDNGCFTHFEHGSIYWSDVTRGIRVVPEVVRQYWAQPIDEGEPGWETGHLGYPVTDLSPRQPNSQLQYQVFEHGTVFVATDAHGSRVELHPGDVKRAENPWLGEPTMDTTNCLIADNGCFRHYKNGSIYWSNTSRGIHVVPAVVRDAWGAAGWENGALGYPTSDPSADPATASTYTQSFQNGSVTVRPNAAGAAIATITLRK